MATSKPIHNHKELNAAVVEVGYSLITVGNALFNLGLGVGSVVEICVENACDVVTTACKTAYKYSQPQMPSYSYQCKGDDGVLTIVKPDERDERDERDEGDEFSDFVLIGNNDLI